MGNKQALGEAKQYQLIQQLNKIPEYYKEFSDTETIIEEAKKFNGKDIQLQTLILKHSINNKEEKTMQGWFSVHIVKVILGY